MRFAATVAILSIAVLGCGKEPPAEPPPRETIAIKYAAGDLEIREAPRDDATLLSTYRTGESVSILAEQREWSEIRMSLDRSGWARTANLAANKAGLVSSASDVRFRVPPEPVTRAGVHGVIRLEADVNIHGDVTGVRGLENSTGRPDLEVLTMASLRKAKFYPLLEDGTAKPFVYEYTASF